MIIRKAIPEDAEAVAKYILLAMEEFIDSKNMDRANELMLHFIKIKNNQYSYENFWVAEEENEIIAAVNLYDGAKLKELREPIAQYFKIHWNKDFAPEDETEAGEYYIDSLAVDSKHRNKGIASTILRFLINEYVAKNKKTLGLLVNEEKIKVKKLYLHLGFEVVGKKFLLGQRMEHLQIKPL